MFKKIISFLKTKTASAVAKNLSIEEQYTKAADTIIDQITNLKNRDVTAENQIVRLMQLAAEKRTLKDRKEAEIIHLAKEGIAVETHGALALLYARTADALEKRAQDLRDMRVRIAHAVTNLDDQRKELAVKLELIRESEVANSMGINTASDVVELAGLTQVNVEDILMRIDTFKGENSTSNYSATSAEIQEYLKTLTGK